MKFEFSAGGVVFKKEHDKILVLVCQHSQHHGWVFPKGLIGDKVENESKEATAIREVEEETGALGKIIDSLPPVSYWYIWDKEKIKKTVYFFLMQYVSGDITRHDTEMENVEWLPMSKVEERISFESEKEIWRNARLKITSSV